MSSAFDRILAARGLTGREAQTTFFNPKYESSYDPFLLPDMEAAVDRLVTAREKQQKITIYGDYDIDGLTASTVLLDALRSFGFTSVDVFIPNRFKEGYGLTIGAVEEIAQKNADLIITVDCGSLSTAEITRARELGVDVIVTDHHNVQKVQPPAVAVINPKRLLDAYPEMYANYVLKQPLASLTKSTDTASRSVSAGAPAPEEALAADASEGSSVNGSTAKLYPFLDLPGVGVAFKLVQALQTRLDGLPNGHEKWLLDLVALGTVCDVVTLQDENRMHVFWGLEVLKKTRRPGLRALMSVAGINQDTVSARDLGFGLGPRMNAAGRLETARYALDMLIATDTSQAMERAQMLDTMNRQRRHAQDNIFKEAITQALQYQDDDVLVVSAEGWNHGIIGIVAAKLLEKYHKPTFVLEELGDESKGSARSYGNFSAADAIRSADDIIIKGGGHKLAAGVTLLTKNIDAFRSRVNQFYKEQGLIRSEEQQGLLASADTEAELDEITEDLLQNIARLEPFGNGNEQPVIRTDSLRVFRTRAMGSDGQHIKLTLQSGEASMEFIAFNAPAHFFVETGDVVTIWYRPIINEWRGVRSVEGTLVRLEKS